jgi:hypothetical protein
MCSIPDPRLARIGTAIDELAEAAAGEGVDRLDRRLADLWAMVAALDPGLAQRLPGYDSGPAGQPGRA